MICPCCKGDSGEIEVVMDEGQGPRWDCGFCDGKGEVNIFKRIYWWYIK